MDLEGLLKHMDEKFKQEGGSVMGLTGISALDYFAAHAPDPTDEWLRINARGMPSARALAAWAWEYAQEMIREKRRFGEKE